MQITPLEGHIFQAIAGFEDDLRQELSLAGQEAAPVVTASRQTAFPTAGAPPPSCPFYLSKASPIFWCQNEWLSPFLLEFDSISEAASYLRGIQRNWSSALFTQFRRGALIAEKLPHISQKPRPFPFLPPDSPMGAWTLLDAHTLLASAACTSPFPNGVIEFVEDKIGPPSRAYLKLWEAFVRARAWPHGTSRCFDAGASPGGWTWALANLGADVIAADRAPLDGRIASLPNVSFIKHDAFTLKPQDIGKIDWLCCDVICYPPRLFEWIETWIASGLCGNFICTIKMQGRPDFETTKSFASIASAPLPDTSLANTSESTPAPATSVASGNVVHLWHNKHELTFYRTSACDTGLLSR